MGSDSGRTTELVLAAEDALGIALDAGERTVLEDLVARRSTDLDDGTLRAQLLQWVLTAEATRRLITNRVLRITGGRVTDDLDLRGVTIPCVLLLRQMHFSGDLLLTGAKTTSLLLRGCTGGVLGLEEATIDGTLRVATGGDDEPSFFEGIALSDATVVRNVEIVGADLDPHWREDHAQGQSEYWPGVDLTRATVQGSLAILGGTCVRGGLVGIDCHVHGNVSLVDAVFEPPDKPDAEALTLLRARIGGSLFLHRPVSGPGERETTRRYTSCFGPAVLARTRIADDVNMNGLQITTPRTRADVPAESAEPVDVADQPQTSEGGRTVDRWWGLDLVGASVGGSVWMNDVAVEGFGVRLTNMTVGADLECDGTLIAPSADLRVSSRSPQRREGAEAEEMVASVPDRAHIAMVAARVEKVLRWNVIWPGTQPVIDLTDSTVGTFEYSSTLGWTDHCYLAGFSFDRIVASYLPFRHRRLANLVKKVLGWPPNQAPRSRPQRWLHRRVFAPDRTHLDWLRSYTRSSFEPSLYAVLAAALERHGQHSDAERVLMARTNDGNRAQGWPRRVLGVPYRVFVGNGYRPQRALIWAVLLTAVGAIAFAGAYQAELLVAVDPTAVAQPFNAVVYSADALLPIVDLHQARSYEAAGEHAGWVRAVLWSMIGLGWVIATSLASAAASYVRRAH